jgi:hypothetical protein
MEQGLEDKAREQVEEWAGVVSVVVRVVPDVAKAVAEKD